MHDRLLLIVGHILIGAIFVRGGVMHFRHFSQEVDGATKQSIPFPKVTLTVGSVWQIVFGLLLVFNQAVEISALALLVFTVMASVLMLDFWNKQGDERQTAMTNFESNVAIVGGLLVTAVTR